MCNRPQPSATIIVHSQDSQGHIWPDRWQLLQKVSLLKFRKGVWHVLCGRRGTLWHSGVFDEGSKGVESIANCSGSVAWSGYAVQMSWIVADCRGRRGTPWKCLSSCPLHPTLHTLHSTLYALHSTLYTPQCAFCTLHSTRHTTHTTLYTN